MSHGQGDVHAKQVVRLTVDIPSGGLGIKLSDDTIEVCEPESSHRSNQASVAGDTPSVERGEPLPYNSSVRREPNTAVTSPTQTRFLRAFPRGWHFGTIGCAVTASLVFLINLIVTIWAATHYGIENGIGTIQDGSCQTTKTLSLWSHLAINVLGTALLSASNYCMQCLSAPTRPEIDRAHERHVWLSVGVQSVRNLLYISRTRALLWVILALSSIPLHLFYNSAIFSTLSTRKYGVFAVSPNLATGKLFDVTAVPPDAYEGASGSHTALVEYGLNLLRDAKNSSIWQRMDNEDCIRKYGQQFVSTRSDFVAVSHALNDSFPIKFVKTVYPETGNGGGPPYNWMCGLYPEAKGGLHDELCRLDNLLPKAPQWAIANDGLTRLWSAPVSSGEPVSVWEVVPAGEPAPVDYCLSRRVEEHCRLQFSLALLIVVIICNFTKAACMISMAYRHDAKPLVTLGDAIASFLKHPDIITLGTCAAPKDAFQTRRWSCRPRPWATKEVAWFGSSSSTRWGLCNVLFIIALIFIAQLLKPGLDDQRLTNNGFKGLWDLGYGTVTFQSLLSPSIFPNGALLLPIFVANLPQLFLSLFYLAYNDLLTCMLLCREWNGYAQHRKPLRVTRPKGKQRSTYFLELPYSYGLPLVIFSGALHWLLSQSIFLARITVFDSLDREDERYSVSTCGYSCIAIISVIFVSTIALLAGNANGFRKYLAGMPLAGSNSAAISAACHAPADDVDASVLPVMWGAVRTEGKVGHCCFTSFEVTPPVVGELYAGLGDCTVEDQAQHGSLHEEEAS